MAITQGSPLPDIKETSTLSSQAPSYYTDYLTNLSNAAATSMNRDPSQMVAGYDPLQVQGYNNLPDATSSYKPQLTAAQNTASQAAMGISPDRINALMNPYTSNVVNEMARLSQENTQRNLLPTMRAGFVGTGGLGSQRYANSLGQSMQDIQRDLTGQQYGALSKGYSEALRGALDEANLLNQTSLNQGKLAQQEYDLATDAVGALTKAGAERQTYQQSILDAPMNAATNASGLMRGFTVPQGQTTVKVGPGQQGQYGKSDLDNIAGILAMVGAASGGSGGKDANTAAGANALAKYGQQAVDWLNRQLTPQASDYDFSSGDVNNNNSSSYYNDTPNNDSSSYYGN